MGTKGVTHIFGLDPWESPGMIGQVGNVSRCISYIRAGCEFSIIALITVWKHRFISVTVRLRPLPLSL